MSNNYFQPFFANSYSAIAPPSDELRNRIYEMHKSNKTFWSAGKLADHFGISLARSKAILRMKEAQEKYISMVSIVSFVIVAFRQYTISSFVIHYQSTLVYFDCLLLLLWQGLTINQEYVDHMDFILNARENFKESEYVEDPITAAPTFVTLKEPELSGEVSNQLNNS